MKFDKKYPWGANPPYSDQRRLVTHLDGHTFCCVKCGEPTSWVCVSLMTATCSEECLAGQVVQGSEKKPASHWLTAKDDLNGDSTSGPSPLQRDVPAPANAG